jgi:alpha-mannosidase
MRSRASRIWILILFGAILPLAACARRKETNRIEINLTGGQAGSTFINGYRRTLAGQVLAYHSSHPDADSALLVRANTEASSITWETDPLPALVEGDYYWLVWLAGLEREGWPGKESHKFDLYINGDRWFTFQNLKDAHAWKWQVPGRLGAELSFAAAMADRAGDLFGTMYLKLPRSAVKPGAPLTLRVQGENAGSLDWYMTLQYPFRFTPAVRAEPALLRDGDRLQQLLRLSCDNLQEGRSIEVSAAGMAPIRQPLDVGANILYLPIPALETQSEIPVVFSVNGEAAGRTSLTVPLVKWREVYLLCYSHNDIGYTDIQPVIERKQRENLDEALRLISQTRNYPYEARFKWNMEVMWPLEGYLAQASEQKRREVIEAVREGSLGLNALYANVLTGLANAAEMSHFTEYAERFAEEHAQPVTTALVSDIPGFTWGIVPALAQSGVKYFASAPNSGDRIGHTLREWGDKPFYWASQSGEEKVLMWVAGASYASFHEGDLTRLGEQKVLKLMKKLDDAAYPYGVVQLPYTIGGDNGPPDLNLPDFVRKWNERYATPRLLIGTHAQMFAELERRHGSSLPVIKGDFTPYWEDGAASTASETALNRRAADRLIQGEALWAICAPASYPGPVYYAAWKNVVLYDEHTWGAHNSVEAPDLPDVKEQWRIKRQFALDADSMSRELLARLQPQGLAKPRGETAVDVYNTQSWPRTDLVLLPPALSAAGDFVVDDKGNPVPSQRLTTGELAVLAESVPPLGARRLLVRPGKALVRGSCRAAAASLENALLSLSVSPKSGAIRSLSWGEPRIELADLSKGPGLNQYLYVPGKDPKDARTLANLKVRVKENGRLVASLLVEADAPGCRKYAVEYRVVDGSPRVDIIHDVDKRAVRTKEGVHIAFPFNVPGGQLRYDVANGIVRPEADQLRGACKNFFSVQSWVDVSNGAYGITWTSPDAPLIEIGAITAEQPWAEAALPSSTIYSYLMNNYWHTNYKADQEGRSVFRFAMVPHAAFRPEQAARLGRESREPLIAMLADPGVPPTASLFQVRPAEVQVTALKPMAGGDAWLVYLYNPTGAAQKVLLAWSKPAGVTMHRSDSSGRRGARINSELEIAAWGSAYLRVDKETSR